MSDFFKRATDLHNQVSVDFNVQTDLSSKQGKNRMPAVTFGKHGF